MQKKEAVPGRAAESARYQFASTLHMLRGVVEVCPQTVWESCYFGFEYPFWYQVYHAAFFIDYWFRDAYDGSPWQSMDFDPRIAPEYEHLPPSDAVISRETMLVFLEKLRIKTERFFDGLTNEKLSRNIIPKNDSCTYADVVFCQIRHVMYNVGYLNGILRSLNLPESDWYAYNEKDE